MIRDAALHADAESPAAAVRLDTAASGEAATIRVVLPFHLRTLARVDGEVTLQLSGPVTQRALLDALEDRYPTLRGTIRDRATGRRRPLVRFFACGEDLSNEEPDAPLPDPIAAGSEPYLVVGAMAGG